MRQSRTIAWWWVFPLVVAWVVVPVVIDLFLPHTIAADKTPDGGFYATTHGLVWGLVVPEALSLIVPVAVIFWLGWWRRVNKDSVPTARWVLAVPILLATASLVFTSYSAYADRGTVFSALVVLAMLLIGASEELMFRGVALEILREGLREGWAAAVSTLLFAAGHFVSGGLSLPTVISAAMGGYLYYLTRRATVFIVFPILVHASFDLFGFSHWGDGDNTGLYFFLCETALFVVVVALTRFVPPASVRARRRAARADGRASLKPEP
jgi:membrane protease YdiL (CAAX protease family)